MISESSEERQERLRKAVEFAGKYARSFEDELLRHWYTAIVEHTLPPGASHAELAADNALRGFVVGIIRQVQLAKHGDPTTPWQRNPYSIPGPQEATPPPSSKSPRRKRRTKVSSKEPPNGS